MSEIVTSYRAYRDPQHPSNKLRPKAKCWGCGALGCVGKHWGNWCFTCNVRRIDGINSGLESAIAQMKNFTDGVKSSNESSNGDAKSF